MDSLTSKLDFNLSISSGNEDSKNEDEEEILLTFTRAQFLTLYYPRQNWSLPDSIIYYITNNPSNSKSYERIIQTCKYFFIKNPILVIHDLTWDSEDDANNCYYYGTPWENVTSKIWTTDLLFIAYKNSPFSSIFPRIYRSDVKKLELYAEIFYSEFAFISSKVEDLILSYTNIKMDDGSNAPIEKLVSKLPKVKSIKFDDYPEDSIITKDTVKHLLSQPHFSNILVFEFGNINDSFDIETFFSYLKKNKIAKYYINFDSMSEGYMNRLKEIVDEVLASAETHEYQLPLIEFEDQDEEKYTKLEALYYP